MSIVIRKAEMKDIQAIQKIAKISWNQTYKNLIPEPIQNRFLEKAYSDDYMEKRIQQTILMVAEEKNKVVGFANVFTKDNVAELSAIYLFPEVEGKGIGTKLLKAIVDQLKGYKEIYVEVEKGNFSGEIFYDAKGFKIIKEFEDDFYGHKLQTKQLVLKLN